MLDQSFCPLSFGKQAAEQRKVEISSSVQTPGEVSKLLEFPI